MNKQCAVFLMALAAAILVACGGNGGAFNPRQHVRLSPFIIGRTMPQNFRAARHWLKLLP